MGIKARRSGGKMGAKTDWFNPALMRAGMDTPYNLIETGDKKGPSGPNFYESYSGQDGAMRTANDRGNLMRPELPPLRDAGVVGRFVQKAMPLPGVEIARKPRRADRKAYQRNVETYEKLRASTPQADPFGSY
jgi:hypothetical protein